MNILKITITNSANDDRHEYYKIAKDSEHEKSLIAEKKAQVDDWNSPGPGKMSIRWLDYDSTAIEDCTLGDLLGLPLNEVAQILNSINELKTL